MTDPERYHRARNDNGLVVIEGFHALKHALRFGASLLDVVTDDAAHVEALLRALAPDAAPLLHAAGVLRVVTPAELDALSPSPHPTRVIALAQRPVIHSDALLCDVIPLDSGVRGGRGHVVILDDPRHGGNIGAAIRVAAAADAGGLFVTGMSDPWHPSAVRGAAGLQFAVPVGRLDALPETRRCIIGVDPDGEDPGANGALSVPDGSILIFGSERSGISSALLERTSRLVRIPMRRGVSSLNLATAVAIMLYHGDQ